MVLVATLYTVSQSILKESYEHIENEQMLTNLKRVESVVKNHSNALTVKLRDWAVWIDVYNYVEDRNEAFIEDNMQDATLTNLEINLMAFTDLEGNTVYAKGLYLNADLTPLPSAFIDSVLNHVTDIATKESNYTVSGLSAVNNEFVFVEALPIRESNEATEANGTILFARILDKELATDFGELTQQTLQIFPFESQDLPADVTEARLWLGTDNPYFTIPLSDTIIAGYVVIKDLRGTPVGIIKTTTPRDVYQQGVRSISFFVLVSSISITLFGFLILWLFEQVLLKRFTKLTNEVDSISIDDISHAKITDKGTDEIGRLSSGISRLMTELNKFQSQEADTRGAEIVANEALKKSSEQSEKMNRLMVGREVKMVELKAEVKHLKEELGEKK